MFLTTKNLSKRKEKAIPRTVSSRSKIISNPCVKNNQITKTHFLLIDYRRSQRKQGKTPGLTIIYNDCKLNEKKVFLGSAHGQKSYYQSDVFKIIK